jgi:2,5-dihydroxypyridine 5,6-dioxygenase
MTQRFLAHRKGAYPMKYEQLVNLFREELSRCKLLATETAIVLSGSRSDDLYAKAALNAVSELGARGFQMHMPDPLPNARPSQKEGAYVGITALTGQPLALETLKKADLIIDLLLLLHSPEQVEILQAGTRMLLVIEPPEILDSRPPTLELRTLVEASEEVLRSAKVLRVTSDAGTDLEMNIGQYPVVTQYGYTDKPGRWDHWPSAFLYTWPNEGETNGKVVLDIGDFLWPINRYLETPITLTIRDGYIREIVGTADASLLREQMESFSDPEAYAVSHIGWGVDPRADWDALKKYPTSTGTDPRSFAGNVQFSTGPNLEAGGHRHTLAHFDMPMRNCTLTLDERIIVRRGEVVAP